MLSLSRQAGIFAQGAEEVSISGAMAEAAATPALMANWRREAEGLGLCVDRIHKNDPKIGLALPGAGAEARETADSRTTCRACRL